MSESNREQHAGAGPRQTLRLSPAPATGLTFRAATSADEVVAAWRMVYLAYRRWDLVDVNPMRVHTAPQAVGPQTLVMLATIGGVTVSTLSGVLDGEAGLPIERVFGDEVRRLRDDGRKTLEIDLFADRREALGRATPALIELMRYVFYFGVRQGVTDFVMGVPPRQARYFARLFGLQIVGEPRAYKALRGRPVAMLRGDFQERFEAEHQRYSVYRYFMESPVEGGAFAQRFNFGREAIGGTALDRWLQMHRSAGDAGQQTHAA